LHAGRIYRTTWTAVWKTRSAQGLCILFKGGKDTLFRIHGTNEPGTIGRAVSSGCIRMLNADVIDLYQRVAKGTRVLVL
jgi:lipoprotein-anchoring transpeptidase ErfK/SrfK